MITAKDVMTHALITDETKAESLAKEINEYASKYNINTQKVIETLTKFQNMSSGELKTQNSIFEGQKTFLKQKLTNNIIDPKILK